jgi:hypothetical protein
MTAFIDPSNPVVALCAEGVQAEGTPAVARRLFERAWAARRDDYDAAIAAHYLARHQPTAAETLHWTILAVRHAEAAPSGAVGPFLASLYLNLADAYARVGDSSAAATAIQHAARSIPAVQPGGYRDLISLGIRRLAARLGVATTPDAAT